MVATLHVGWPMKWRSSADEAAQSQLCTAKLEFLVCAGQCANSRFAQNIDAVIISQLEYPGQHRVTLLALGTKGK